jgi:hypothetical protein
MAETAMGDTSRGDAAKINVQVCYALPDSFVDSFCKRAEVVYG